MFSDPITLYKLMILYMLGQVDFPLSNTQLSEFFLSYNYTSYFMFQKAISELVSTNLISIYSSHSVTKYELENEGEETLKFFTNKISPAAIEDMNEYISKNKFKFRSETGNIAEYYQTSNLDYIVHFEIREGKTKLINMELSATDEETAKHMCDMWRDNSIEIYQYLIKKLMG
jgi:hypothetical protein